MGLEKICQSRFHEKCCWNKISFILTLVTDSRKTFSEKIVWKNLLPFPHKLKSVKDHISQFKCPIWSEFPKYLSFRSIHKVQKFETNQREHSTGLEWNKLSRWGTDPGLGGYISNYSSVDDYLPYHKSFRSRSTEVQRYPNPLIILCGRWMPEYFMGLALSALWFYVQRTKYGWKQHTQTRGGWATVQH